MAPTPDAIQRMHRGETGRTLGSTSFGKTRVDETCIYLVLFTINSDELATCG